MGRLKGNRHLSLRQHRTHVSQPSPRCRVPQSSAPGTKRKARSKMHNSLLGLSSDMLVLLLAALAGGVILIIGGLSVNQPFLWRIGVRNLTRRPAQTLLLLCGLALSL